MVSKLVYFQKEILQAFNPKDSFLEKRSTLNFAFTPMLALRREEKTLIVGMESQFPNTKVKSENQNEI